MIQLKDVIKTFHDGEGENRILKGINLEVRENEFLTLMGPSGCGKSTLLNIMALLTEPTEGSLYFDNELVNFKKEKRLEFLRANKVGLIFQNPNLISCLSPLDNVLIAMNAKESNGVKKKKALELLDMLGVADKSKGHIKSLSGGEAQRVAIVRALVNEPKILLCDEPTGALDMENGNRVMELLLETRKRTNCALVIVTHDKSIGELGERKIELRGGRILGVGQSIQALQRA